MVRQLLLLLACLVVVVPATVAESSSGESRNPVSTDGLYNVLQVPYGSSSFNCGEKRICRQQGKLSIVAKVVCFVSTGTSKKVIIFVNEAREDKENQDLEKGKGETLSRYEVQGVSKDKLTQDDLKHMCDSVVFDPEHQDTVRIHNKGWWCDRLPINIWNGRLDKCEVVNEERTWSDSEYRGVRLHYLKRTNTDNLPKEHTFKDPTGPNVGVLCEKGGVKFEAKFIEEKIRKGGTAIRFYVRASYNSYFLHYYRIVNKSYNIKSTGEEGLKTSCRLFNAKVEEEGRTMTVHIQVYKQGGWSCSKFYKQVHHRSFHRKVIRTDASQSRPDPEHNFYYECPKFNDYEIPVYKKKK